MTTAQNPSPDHPRFDAICARVEEWEPLPTVTAELPSAAPGAALTEAESHAPAREEPASLDALILAALVSP